MFEKAGVDVELIQFGRGSEAVDALAAGQVDLAGSSDATTVTQFHQSPELVALFATRTSGEYVKVVLRDDVKPENIKKMMIVVRGLSEIATAKYLESRGNQSRIGRVHHRYPQRRFCPAQARRRRRVRHMGTVAEQRR